MPNFFDYVYYKACNFYKKETPGSQGVSGLTIMAVVQLFHIFTCFFLITIFLKRKIHFNKLFIVGLCILLLVLNGIRYNKLTYSILKEKWDNEDRNTKQRKQALVLLYIILSIILTISLAIYVGSKDWAKLKIL
jgi:glucan phosphoethanolaminetransferase (alkaline phosphatase superfamily)